MTNPLDVLAGLITLGPRFGASAPKTAGDLGFHSGTIVAWDATTGENTIAVAGGTVNDVPVLSTSDSILLIEGDVVGLLRFKTTYFILGRIAAPGDGAGLQIRFAQTDAAQNTTAEQTFVDLATPGPIISDLYIGSSRRARVDVSCSINATDDEGVCALYVTGASTIGPVFMCSLGGANSSSPSNNNLGTAMSTYVLTADDGLNEGLHEFRLKYGTASGTSVQFGQRRLIVQPF